MYRVMGKLKGAFGGNREGDMKGGRGGMRARSIWAHLGKGCQTSTCHALSMTRGSQTRSYSPRK